MENLHFETITEFENYSESHKKEISIAILNAVGDAIRSNKKSAKILDIAIESEGFSYDVSLASANWEQALTVCLDFFKDTDANRSIETWELLQKIK